MTRVQTFDAAAGQMLVGFSGRAGSGKDSCADILQQHGFARLAFADALRDEVSEAWRIDPRMLADRSTKEWEIPAMAVERCADACFIAAMRADDVDIAAPRSPRWVLQRWGTEYRREADPDYWIVKALHRLQRLRANGRHRVCITDVRFFNEALAVRSIGGHVVEVHRPGLPAMPAGTAGHASECGPLPRTAGVVHNDGDLGHLHAELLRVLGPLGLAEAQEVEP